MATIKPKRLQIKVVNFERLIVFVIINNNKTERPQIATRNKKQQHKFKDSSKINIKVSISKGLSVDLRVSQLNATLIAHIFLETD